MRVLPRSKTTPRTGDVATLLSYHAGGDCSFAPEHRRESMSPDPAHPPLESRPSTPRKIRVAVLLGGPSPEREVSLRSGEQVVAALDPSRFDVLPVEISLDGQWLPRPDLLRL
ncbi:MAG TPA: hypothetical protein VK587_04880, partial [bacterium]|nr:hypothetical protein [bacterium]